MKVLITGARYWTDGVMIDVVISGLMRRGDTLTILHGDCPRGADAFADTWKNVAGVTVEPHPANWKKFGRGAGPIRNRDMLQEKPELVIAFTDDLETSQGTKDCVTEAVRRGIPVWHLRHLSRPQEPVEAT